MEYHAKSEFLDFLELASGTYAFALRGLQTFRRQYETLPTLPGNPDPIVGWTDGDPNVVGNIQSRLGWRRSELIKNLEFNGISSLYLGWAWVTLVYDRWEDDFRGRLAREMGCNDRDDVKCDAMGDLCHIRNDITHKKGKATKAESGRCKILKHWFEIGKPIRIGERNASELYDIMSSVDAIYKRRKWT